MDLGIVGSEDLTLRLQIAESGVSEDTLSRSCLILLLFCLRW
jgi:hypothetical protein